MGDVAGERGRGGDLRIWFHHSGGSASRQGTDDNEEEDNGCAHVNLEFNDALGIGRISFELLGSLGGEARY